MGYMCINHCDCWCYGLEFMQAWECWCMLGGEEGACLSLYTWGIQEPAGDAALWKESVYGGPGLVILPDA